MGHQLREVLGHQSDCIAGVLHAHSIPARVTGGTVTPFGIRFRVLPAVGASVSRIKQLEADLAAALGVDTCRVARRGAAIELEIPRDHPRPVRLLNLLQQLEIDEIPPVTAILGVAEDGSPLLIRLPSPDVGHVLVAGAAESGKTSLLQSMVLSMAMMNSPGQVKMMLIALRGNSFGSFDGSPHLARPTIQGSVEAAEALQSLVRLVERRHRLLARSPEGLLGEGHVVAIIDELGGLLASSREASRSLAQLLERGRAAGVHVVAALQLAGDDAVDELLSSLVGAMTSRWLAKAGFSGMASIPVRLVGRVESASDGRFVGGQLGAGAARLQGRGDFLGVVFVPALAEGRVTRFQAAYVTAGEIEETVMGLSEGAVPRSRKLIDRSRRARCLAPAPTALAAARRAAGR